MLFFTIFLALFFSLFSTGIMSYISMATPIGPWIAPTIALVCVLICSAFAQKNCSKNSALIVAASSIGGILATACGFSFPTLFFLDPVAFTSWMESPLFFAGTMAGLSVAAGSFGLIIADQYETQLLNVDKLPFPIGQLVYKTIAAGTQIKKAYELLIGFFSTIVFCFAQDVMRLIPRSVTLISKCNWYQLALPDVPFDLWPMLWAIGFVTGHVIALPLAVGAITKIVLVDPANKMYFSDLTTVEFVLAFASGMVVYGAVMGFWELRRSFGKARPVSLRTPINVSGFNFSISGAFSILVSVAFLTYFQMPVFAQLFLLIGTWACTYQIAVIAGKIGLAPLGRFATFIMVPAMLMFNTTYTHLVFIATYVEIAGGVAADVLFGRKMAQLAGVNKDQVRRYQWLGLLISSLAIGAVFWLLINRFELGSPELFAYKAQSRQLLISAKAFNWLVLLMGAIFSHLLKLYKINPMLVLGGLLMPINISLGLIFGGLLPSFTDDRERWEPLWSGVFAANSLWMILKSLF